MTSRELTTGGRGKTKKIEDWGKAQIVSPSVHSRRKGLVMRLFPMVVVLLILLGSEEVFDFVDKSFSLLLEAAFPGDGVTRTRSGRGRC